MDRQTAVLGEASGHTCLGKRDERITPRLGRIQNRMLIVRQGARHTADAHPEADCFRGSMTQSGTGSYCTGVEGRVLNLLLVMPP